MSDFLPRTFTVADATGFQSEFADFINKRNLLLHVTAEDDYKAAMDSGFKTAFVLLSFSNIINNGIGLGKQAYKPTELSPARIAEIREGVRLQANKFCSYPLSSPKLDKLFAKFDALVAAEKLRNTYNVKITIFTKIPAILPWDLGLSSIAGKRITQHNLDVVSARLNLAIADRVLRNAIIADLGTDIEVTKWPRVNFPGGVAGNVFRLDTTKDNLIISLHKPTLLTREAIVHDATSATLRAYINPRHVETYGWFEYGTTIAYGTLLPVDPANMGSGSVDASLTQLPENLTPETTYHYRVVCNHKWLGQFVGEDVTFTTPEQVHPVLPITVYCTGGYTGNTPFDLANGLVDPNGCTPVSRGTITATTGDDSSVDVNGAAVLSGTPYSSVEVQAVDVTNTLVYSGHTFHNSGAAPVSITVTYEDCVAWIAAGSIFAGGGAWCNNQMGE